MVTARNTRSDVMAAAGRLFAERGYHGTSMRDLGQEVGLLGSSLYSHIDSKQELLVGVVEEGARLFRDSAERALAVTGPAPERLRALIAGHVDVVLDNHDVVRTFLNEARMLESEQRRRVIGFRDEYEESFRTVISDGIAAASFGIDVDPKLATIFTLSILNAIERWYDPAGRLDRDELVDVIHAFVLSGLGVTRG